MLPLLSPVLPRQGSDKTTVMLAAEDICKAPVPAPGVPDDSGRSTRPGTKRLLLTLSVLLSFILALPFLLKSTEIYRSSLPFHSVHSLSSLIHSHPTTFPCRFHAVFLRPVPSGAPILGRMLSEEMRRIAGAGSPACGLFTDGNYSISVSIDYGGECSWNWDGQPGGGYPWTCGALRAGELTGSDEDVDELLRKALTGDTGCSPVGGKLYTVVVIGGEGQGDTRVVVGKYHHAWVVGNLSESEVLPVVAKLFVHVFMHGGVKHGDEEGNGEFMPVGSDGAVTLSFTLLNASPKDWLYDWDFHNFEESLLAPVVEELAPLASIRLESQVLYHTSKSSLSYWDHSLEKHTFGVGDLPFFVNSKEWHLDTSVATTGRSKVLQFVVYVPPPKECPLILRLPNNQISSTNGFISPMWGGVIVWNPPTCSQSSHPAKKKISEQDLHKLFGVFIGQLRLLFGLNSYDGLVAELGISKFLASDKGFTEWELDLLFRRHTCFNLLSCATTLESLSNLVQSLPRMIVLDEIGKQVKLSLEAANSARINASHGAYDSSAALSRQARALAEDAFFHPSITSISYSSIEHYFAVYMPFFAPVSLHVILAAIRELKRYRERRRRLASDASHVKAL